MRNQKKAAMTIFSLAFFSLSVLAQSTASTGSKTFYVATTGSDSTGDGSIGHPWLTPQHGFSSMSCGDTLYIRGGEYGGLGGQVGTVPFCSDWAHATNIKNYPGEHVVFTNPGQESIMGFGTTNYPTHQSIFLIMEADVQNGITFDAATENPKISSCITGLSIDYVRLINIECTNAGRVGIIPHGEYWEIINANIHHNGLDTDPSHARSHGVYLTDGHCLIDGGRYWDNGGYGIQIYDSGSTTNSYNVVRNALIYDNNLTSNGDPLNGNGGGGLILGNGTANGAYNNILWHNGQINIQINASCDHCFAYNNTQTGGMVGLEVVAGASGTIVRNNIIFGNQGSNIVDGNSGSGGTSSLIDHNLTGDPMFANPQNHDYRLLPGSPAIDAGIDLSSIFVRDFAGQSRPAGPRFDIGAYEFGSAQAQSDNGSPLVTLKVVPHK